MKHMFFKVLLAAIILLLCGAGLAQEELHTIELNFFSRGGLPETQPATYALRDNFDAYVYEQLMQQSASIDVRNYGMDVETFKLRLENLVNSNPKLFFVDNGFQVAANTSGIILRLIPSYLYTGEDLQNRLAAFDAAIAEIAAYTSKASTDIGKLLLLNDYFCVNFAYDHSLSIFGPDQLLSGGTGVCQAYMLAVSAVLDELGIPNTHATSHSMQHTWNVIELDGSWYHLDVTWNDPIYPLCAGHNYFLLSDAGIEAAGHSSWTSEAACFDTRYDSNSWRNINTPLGVSGDCVYFLDPEVNEGIRTICCMDTTTGEIRDVHRFSIRAANGNIAYYDGFEPISAGDGRIFYAARGRLHAVAPDGKNVSFIYTSGSDIRQIWSCWYSGNSIYMLVGDVPNKNSEVVCCDADKLIAFSASPQIIHLAPGKSLQLEAAFSEEVPGTASISWISTSSAATVSASGLVRAVSPGVALIKARCYDGLEALAAVIVEGVQELKLPAALKEIRAEAFAGTDARIIELPEGIQAIGPRAFAECEKLELVFLPDSLESIAADAFEGNSSIAFVCKEGSYAQAFARENGMGCILAE